MDIHKLMRGFANLRDANIGHGPKHPTQPNLALKQEIEAFLDQYPVLRQDQGYVEFLECYAGAWLDWQPSEDLVIGLLGFDMDVTANIANPDEGHPVDENGYLMFCDGIVRIHEGVGRTGVIGQTFAFDATDKRKAGVYRSTSDRNGITDYYWYCGSFLEWLTILLATKGNFPEKLG